MQIGLLRWMMSRRLTRSGYDAWYGIPRPAPRRADNGQDALSRGRSVYRSDVDAALNIRTGRMLYEACWNDQVYTEAWDVRINYGGRFRPRIEDFEPSTTILEMAQRAVAYFQSSTSTIATP